MNIFIILLIVFILVYCLLNKRTIHIEQFNSMNNRIIHKSEGGTMNYFNHTSDLDTSFQNRTINRDKSSLV